MNQRVVFLRAQSSLILLAMIVFYAVPSASADDPRIEFSRDIQPILAANCYGCHGKDEAHREGGLRLDTFEGATLLNAGHAAVVPGDWQGSELSLRVQPDDPSELMPPKESGKSLKPEEIERLKLWIQSGAKYSQHWAFTPPVRPPVPEVKSNWIRNPIDAFILQTLQQQGLEPSPRANLETLARRLSLDLVGLPPTVATLETLQKHFPNASAGQSVSSVGINSASDDKRLGSLIDDLLSSPHFGEKWARPWLDAARYADSDGFEKDKPRFAWFYRDWVVQAFNNDKPYDQFVIEQLAGDLLPGRTQDQLVATGFLRNSMINEEGGVDPEQFRMEAMFDRVDALGKAIFGLTIQCSQCHDHKYDPISTVEYYQLFSILNNCHEAQATVYSRSELAKRQELLSEIARQITSWKCDHPEWQQSCLKWAESLRSVNDSWHVLRPELDTSGGQKHYLLDDGSILAQGYAPTQHTTDFIVDTDLQSLTAFRLELLNDPNLPHGGPGRSVDGLCALTEFEVTVHPHEESAKDQKLKFISASADVNPPSTELAAIYHNKTDAKRVTGPVTMSIDGDKNTAWGIDIGGGRSNVPRQAIYRPEVVPQSQSGFRITIRLAQNHGGWNSDDNQTNNLGRFRLSVSSEEQAAQEQVAGGIVSSSILRLANEPSENWSEDDWSEMFDAWRVGQADAAELNAAIESLWQQHPRGTTQLVLAERGVPRYAVNPILGRC